MLIAFCRMPFRQMHCLWQVGYSSKVFILDMKSSTPCAENPLLKRINSPPSDLMHIILHGFIQTFMCTDCFKANGKLRPLGKTYIAEAHTACSCHLIYSTLLLYTCITCIPVVYKSKLGKMSYIC